MQQSHSFFYKTFLDSNESLPMITVMNELAKKKKSLKSKLCGRREQYGQKFYASQISSYFSLDDFCDAREKGQFFYIK